MFALSASGAETDRDRALVELFQKTCDTRDGAFFLSAANEPCGIRVPGAEEVSSSANNAARKLVLAWKGEAGSGADHAQALASLMLGHYDDALTAQEGSARQAPGSPEAWNDLAAIRLARMLALSRPADLPAALATADRALRLNPQFAPARFNRAAIVEYLGVRSEAARAWLAFLESEPHGRAADQVLRRLSQLNRPTDATQWDAARARVDRVTDMELAAIAKAFPQQSRAFAEVVIQSQWGTAYQAGDRATASHQLGIARVIGAALKDSGESLLADSVARIDRAAPEEKMALAQAHIAYGKARFTLRDRASDAIVPLHDAADLFRESGSPMEPVARLYQAIALIELQRNGEALPILNDVLRSERGAEARHPALIAQTLWEVGLCEAWRGRWSAALYALNRAKASFRSLGEHGFEARVQSIIGECHDVLGQSDDGWKERLAAIRMLSAQGDLRSLQVAVTGGTLAAMAAGQWDRARALSKLEIAIARDAESPLETRSHIRAAIIHARLNDDIGARNEIAAGRSAAALNPNIAEAVRNSADLDFAEALNCRAAAPTRAIALVDRVIAAYERASLDIYLPAFYLERGRLWLQQRDDRNAASDFATAVRYLTSQREQTHDPDLRSGMFNNVTEVFDESIRLASRQGDLERLFAVVEQSRARALLDKISAASGTSPPEARSAVVREQIGDATLLEFSVLPEKVIALVLQRDRIATYEIAKSSADLQAEIAAMRNFIAERKPSARLRAVSERLFSELLAPAGLAPGTALILSPDGAMQGLPWAALQDPTTHEYLISKHSLLLTPSTAVFLTNSRRARLLARNPLTGILAIGNPAFDAARFPDLPNLAFSQNEAATVRSLYRQGETWIAAEATATRFLRSAPQYDIVHFAGHSVAAESDYDESFLLFAPDRDAGHDGLLYASDIARMRFPSTRLVVLASCSTAQGTSRALEGPMSVARSFLAAGVPAVAAALWDVGDQSSSPLFHRLHQELRQGASPEIALQRAQLSMLESATPSYRQPAAWAGVQITGGIFGDH